MASTSEVRLAIPKGRMFDNILTLLSDAGMGMKVDARNLRPQIQALPDWSIKLLKPRNVVEMLFHGTRDLGFAGRDIVQELGRSLAADNPEALDGEAAQMVEYLDTGLDPVRIVVAVPPAFVDAASGQLPKRNPNSATGCWRIATEYVELTRAWCRQHELTAEIIRTFGSTEVFPPEDADFIVDNTATGTTLRANGLIIYDTLMVSSTMLYVHRSALACPAKKEAIDNFVLLLKGALLARSRVLLDFNVGSQDDLDRIVAQLPALRRPTVSPLAGADGFAVRSAVPRSEVTRLIPLVKACGGSDLIISKVEQIIL